MENKDDELLRLLKEFTWPEIEEALEDFSIKIEGTPFLEEHFLDKLELFPIAWKNYKILKYRRLKVY